jgi:isochorismate hydrolase
MKKTRSPEEKIGRIKWNTILLNRVLDEIQRLRKEMRAENLQIREEMKQLRVMERAIINGFSGSGLIKYTVPMIQQKACVDQVDIEILDSARGFFLAFSRTILILTKTFNPISNNQILFFSDFVT